MRDVRLPALLLARGFERTTHAGRRALVRGTALEWWGDLEAPSWVTLHRVAGWLGMTADGLRERLEGMGRG